MPQWHVQTINDKQMVSFDQYWFDFSATVKKVYLVGFFSWGHVYILQKSFSASRDISRDNIEKVIISVMHL